MTPKQADKLIASGLLARFQDKYGDQFNGIAASRDRRTIKIALYASSGEFKGNGLFHRDELTIIS